MSSQSELKTLVLVDSLTRKETKSIKSDAGIVKNWFLPYLKTFLIPPTSINQKSTQDDIDFFIAMFIKWRELQTKTCAPSTMINCIYAVKFFYSITPNLRISFRTDSIGLPICWDIIAKKKKFHVVKQSKPITDIILAQIIEKLPRTQKQLWHLYYAFRGSAGVRADQVFPSKTKIKNFSFYHKKAVIFKWNKSKTNQVNKIQSCTMICKCRVNKNLCFVHLLEDWLKEKRPGKEVVLFPFSYLTAVAHLRSCLKASKLSDKEYSDHGFRRGSAQDMAASGVGIINIMKQHSWKSERSALAYFDVDGPTQAKMLLADHTRLGLI